MRLNFDGFAGFVKIDAGRFLPFSQSGFMFASISACSVKQAHFQDSLSALHLQKQADFCMGSAQMIRGSIWTLPFGIIRFSQFNTASADIFTRCRFFSVRMEESPQIIALNHILIAADFPA